MQLQQFPGDCARGQKRTSLLEAFWVISFSVETEKKAHAVDSKSLIDQEKVYNAHKEVVSFWNLKLFSSISNNFFKVRQKKIHSSTKTFLPPPTVLDTRVSVVSKTGNYLHFCPRALVYCWSLRASSSIYILFQWVFVFFTSHSAEFCRFSILAACATN